MAHSRFLFENTVPAKSGDDLGEEHFIFNMPKLMSSVNRRHFTNVDKAGNAQLYMMRATFYADNGAVRFWGAPNTYYTRKAVKAAHDARAKMFKRAGVSLKSLGYARYFRPYLSVMHENGGYTEIDTEDLTASSNNDPGITPNYQGETWNYSRAAVSTPQENLYVQNFYTQDNVDTYSFTLLDGDIAESVTPDDPDESGAGSDQDSFVSVGVINGWLGSFPKRRAGDDAGGHVERDADNWLNQLRADSASSEEVLELAEQGDQERQPWDLDSSQYKNKTILAHARTSADQATVVDFLAPCGLFELEHLNYSDSTSLHHITFEVMGIVDMDAN